MKKVMYMLLFIPFLNCQATAQNTVMLSDKWQNFLLSDGKVSLYKDPSGSLTAQNVLRRKFIFSKINKDAADFSTSAHWLKFTVKNESTSSEWLLELLDFGIDQVSFYNIQQDSLIETGYSKPFRSRAYNHKNFVFPLSLPPGASGTYLLKISSSRGFGPTIKIRSTSFFISYATTEYLLLGIYYGLLLLIASYNLFLYLTLKDKSHLYYVVYVISIGFRSFEWDGLAFQHLWPSYPFLNQWLHFAPELLLVSFSIYTIHFLELRKNHFLYYNIILISLGIYFALFTLDLFLAVKHLQLLYLLVFLLIYGTSIVLYRRGFKAARFFVLGYSFLIISQIVYFIISKGIRIEHELLVLVLVYSLQIGFVIEAFIFSLALADKIKLFKKEKEAARQLIIDQLRINEELKDKVNLELELKVSERTIALEEAKRKLLQQAEKINYMNSQLDLENYSLKSNVKEINIERGLLKSLSLDEFIKTFPDEKACYRFIQEVKWKEGFVCRKCSGQKYLNHNDPFVRRCTKCHYIETIKANTIFHNLKFPIEKAFQIVFLTLTSEKEISTYELARIMDLQQKTCWSFRQKIIDQIETKQIRKKDLMEQGWGILILSNIQDSGKKTVVH